MRRTVTETFQEDQVVQAALARIEQIDLSPIKFKLTHQLRGLGWRQEKADKGERLYRRFLALTLVYGNSERVAPSKIVDDFWHQHIVDTNKYSDDCLLIFGEFLHHRPYFGMQDDEDELTAVGERMKKLYQYHFDVDVDDATSCCSGGPVSGDDPAL